MLKNLKLVLLQHRKFLVIFFIVMFLPSIILAFFGIRAIYNEQYKLQQQNLEQKKDFLKDVRVGILSLIESNVAKLKDLAAQKIFSDKDYRRIHELVSAHLGDESLFGQIVIWNEDGTTWFPGYQKSPSFAKTLTVPQEWKKLRPGLEIAERAEFRRRNYSEAVSQYKRIFDRKEDRQVKAWLLNRIARCEAKRGMFEQALSAYRSIISDYDDLFTESGRSLGLTCRLEMLDVFRMDKDYESFFRESIHIFEFIELDVWPLDGDQLKMYSDVLKNMIGEVMVEDASEHVPEGFIQSMGDFHAAVRKNLRSWQMAEVAGRNILPGVGNDQIQRNVIPFGGEDVLVILIPLGLKESSRYREFLGSLVQISDVITRVGDRLEENGPVDGSVVIRSSLTGKVVFGNLNASQGNAVITDFFPGNFPPWRMELYQTEDGKSGFVLHKNIFFWTILALLIIVVFGSGLIIRTLVQEVNLLNLKSDFIASVSHEFKTPLTAMGAVLERLLSDEVKDPKKTKEYYRILSHDSERLKRLVKNVLDFTKIEDGKREYRFVPTDISRLVRHEVDNFLNENRMSGFTVEAKTDNDIPPVYVDEEAMSQALHNILDNAAKFSGPEKDVEVKIIRQPDSVEIAVQDRGVGIPDSEQKKVFEKFYRGKQASSVSPTGTGLGLTLVKHIIDAHSGDILITSQPGKGTCVSLILPAWKGG
jgi:signal transduction histidine kinase